VTAISYLTEVPFHFLLKVCYGQILFTTEQVVCLCLCVCVCVCVYLCMCVFTHIDTHIMYVKIIFMTLAIIQIRIFHLTVSKIKV